MSGRHQDQATVSLVMACFKAFGKIPSRSDAFTISARVPVSSGIRRFTSEVGAGSNEQCLGQVATYFSRRVERKILDCRRPSQSLLAPLPLSYYLHYVVFPKALSYVPSFSQFTSHILLQLYLLTASINSNRVTIHSFLSSFSIHLYLAVSAASSGVSLLFTAGSSTMVWF